MPLGDVFTPERHKAPLTNLRRLKSKDMPKFYYSQLDKRWASQRIGSALFTLGQKGCCITEICESLGDFGFTVTPDILAKDPTLFTDKNHEKGAGLVLWGEVARWLLQHYPSHTFTFHRFLKPDPKTINANLKPGTGVLLEVANGSHWLKADRKCLLRQDWNCRDPWGGVARTAIGDYGDVSGFCILQVT